MRHLCYFFFFFSFPRRPLGFEITLWLFLWHSNSKVDINLVFLKVSATALWCTFDMYDLRCNDYLVAQHLSIKLQFSRIVTCKIILEICQHLNWYHLCLFWYSWVSIYLCLLWLPSLHAFIKGLQHQQCASTYAVVSLMSHSSRCLWDITRITQYEIHTIKRGEEFIWQSILTLGRPVDFCGSERRPTNCQIKGKIYFYILFPCMFFKDSFVQREGTFWKLSSLSSVNKHLCESARVSQKISFSSVVPGQMSLGSP